MNEVEETVKRENKSYKGKEPSIVVHTCNTSIQEVEAGEKKIYGHPGLHIKTQSQKKKKKKKNRGWGVKRAREVKRQNKQVPELG
jgi:hypothetical protein